MYNRLIEVGLLYTLYIDILEIPNVIEDARMLTSENLFLTGHSEEMIALIRKAVERGITFFDSRL